MLELTNEQSDLQKREYDLRCTVVRKPVNYFDEAEGKQHRADLIILDPREGTERDMFFTAWLDQCLPDEKGVSKLQLPIFIASPVSLNTKVRFCWPDEIYPKPYLLVTAIHIERMINFNPEIKDVNIKVFRQERVYEDMFANGRHRG